MPGWQEPQGACKISLLFSLEGTKPTDRPLAQIKGPVNVAGMTLSVVYLGLENSGLEGKSRR